MKCARNQHLPLMWNTQLIHFAMFNFFFFDWKKKFKIVLTYSNSWQKLYATILITDEATCMASSGPLKGATSQFARLQTFSLNFSSSSFEIRVNLFHP